MYVALFNPDTYFKIGYSNLFMQMRKPRLRDVKQLAQGHTATHSGLVQPRALALLKRNKLPPDPFSNIILNLSSQPREGA